MKVLIVLALALAVANAAFTGSLVQQTKPLLNQAKVNMQVSLARNVRARNSAEAGFQTALIQGLHDQAAAILEQIEAAVNAGTEAASWMVEQYNEVTAQLSNLGSEVVGAASGILEGLMNNLSGMWNSIFGSKLRSSLEITPQLASIIQMAITNPTFVNLFRSEPMYQCLKSKGITVDYAHMQALNQAGQLNTNLLNKPEVAQCLAEAGGIQAVLQGSATIKFVQALVHQLGMAPMVHQVLNQLLGSTAAQAVIDLLSQRHRGFFDGLSNLWGAISEGASNAWDNIQTGISNGASNFYDYVANVVSNVYDSAAAQFTAAQNMASMFLTNAMQNAQQMGIEGAIALMEMIQPYANDMGDLYTQVSAQLTAIYGDLTQFLGGSSKF